MSSVYQSTTETATRTPLSKPLGFIAKFLPPRDPRQVYTHAANISLMSEQEKWNHLGFINSFVYKIAERAEAVTYVTVRRNDEVKREYTVDGKKINRIVERGYKYVKTSISGICKYLENYWEGFAAKTRLAVCRTRDSLHELGFFNARKMFKGCYTWSEFRDIDYGGLLQYASMLEESLITENGVAFEDFPEHKGYFMKVLYNKAHEAMGGYWRRKYEPGVIGVDKFQCKIMRLDPEDPENCPPNDLTYKFLEEGEEEKKVNHKTFYKKVVEKVTKRFSSPHERETVKVMRIFNNASPVNLITDMYGQTPDLIDEEDPYIYTF